MEYPTAKQVKHKLITAIIPRIISIGSALLTLISALRRIMLNGGSQVYAPLRSVQSVIPLDSLHPSGEG